ncbi:hypothetical protein CFBP6625_05415 [Agrobacterium tumefaciens]|jgi:hypothetical protein|nr:hypothetical protein CFBP6625_05415 [Agrobacterium tumefaciens]
MAPISRIDEWQGAGMDGSTPSISPLGDGGNSSRDAMAKIQSCKNVGRSSGADRGQLRMRRYPTENGDIGMKAGASF